MNNQLQQSMRPMASFIFDATNSENDVKLCLIPGHYDTSEILIDTETNKAVLGFCNPQAIKDAGFQCDQVADDYNTATAPLYAVTRGADAYPVKISGSKRCRYRDFLNYVKYSGMRVVKIRIQNLTDEETPRIFDSELEVSASAIGSKAGSDFVRLSSYRNASNFDRTFIEVDLSSTNLLLDETTLVSLEVPSGSKFQMDFTLAKI